ncbi:SOS response-associated peptidase [Salinicola avicenniae]|uniref:SOS response-associated peptidase n=1 Tax=Salinicola avicenniae TaxID=2916836 RepID=UPI0020730992|nr:MULTISPECIES: SOS response-associated peptidase [unclassified Salinicola]
MAGRLHIDDWTRDRTLPGFRSSEPPILTPNAAPRRWLSILRHEAGETVLREAFWGLTPTWLKVLDHAPHCARAESLQERPMFREALASRRCLLPVSGIYVWQPGLRGKQPFLITRTDRGPLLLAALWSRYALDSQVSRDSFALITVPVSAFVAPLSERLPAIIDSRQAATWLAADTATDHAEALLEPADRELLGAFPVSKRVNDPAHQEWACAYPVGPMRVWTP